MYKKTHRGPVVAGKINQKFVIAKMRIKNSEDRLYRFVLYKTPSFLRVAKQGRLPLCPTWTVSHFWPIYWSLLLLSWIFRSYSIDENPLWELAWAENKRKFLHNCGDPNQPCNFAASFSGVQPATCIGSPGMHRIAARQYYQQIESQWQASEPDSCMHLLAVPAVQGPLVSCLTLYLSLLIGRWLWFFRFTLITLYKSSPSPRSGWHKAAMGVRWANK